LRDLILGLKAKGKTILFSSHELSEAELMCDRIAIMKAGALVLDKPMTEVAGDGNTNLERIFLNVLKSP
jgi:ABC-type Na+ transport system ATPase subunit NatA